MIGPTAAARRAAALLFETLLPSDCLLCGDWLPWRQEGGVCPPCWGGLDWSPGVRVPRRGPLDLLAWSGRYEGALQRLIRVYKFERFDPLGRPLGRAAARRWGAATPRGDRTVPGAAPLLAGDSLIVPVPLHWTRRLRRGFNPAALLARGLAEESGLSLHAAGLVRERRGRRQLGLGRHERRAALQGVFAAPPRSRRLLAGRTVLLVDDVVTTGATLEACAAALKAAGALRVIGLALARTPKLLAEGPREP